MAGIPIELTEYHRTQCDRAKVIYVASMSPKDLAADWRTANIRGRRQIVQALRDTNCLRDIEGGLRKNAGHMFVLRALFAPPISQDQLGLLCSGYSKAAEKRAGGMTAAAAKAVAITFLEWR
jgi:hypothetical protein